MKLWYCSSIWYRSYKHVVFITDFDVECINWFSNGSVLPYMQLAILLIKKIRNITNEVPLSQKKSNDFRIRADSELGDKRMMCK